MTVTSETSKVEYISDGVTLDFPIDYYFLEDTDIQVVVSDSIGTIYPVALNTDYTITGAGNPSGGELHFISAPLIDLKIAIFRNAPATQLTDYQPNDDFPAKSHERALDKLTMLVQQVLSVVSNSLQKSVTGLSWNFLGLRGVNAADPIDDQDVTTKSWVSTQIDTLKAYAEALVAGVVGGYGVFLQGGVGAIIRTFQDKMRERVSILDFGPVNDGIADAGAAAQKAFDYLATLGGGELIYPPGTYKHITTPKLPMGLANNLYISCYGAKLVAVAGGRIFDTNRTANDQTLQNVFIRGAFIDFTAMTGRNHVLLGTYVNGVQQQRVNFRNVHFEDIGGIGPAPDATLTNHVICLYLQCSHATSRESTAGYIDDISLTNVKMTGGNAGYLIVGNALDALDAPNISMSTIVVNNSEHKITTPPSVFFASSNLHIGLDAIVKSVAVNDFYGENPGDNGVEVNNCRTVTLSNIRIKNFQNVGYYIDNKNPDFDSASQIITYDGCTGDMDGFGTRAFQLGPYVDDGPGGSDIHGKIGQVTYRDCCVRVRNLEPTAGGFGINAGLNGEYLYDSISIENFKVDVLFTASLTGNRFPAILTFRSSGPVRIDINGVTQTYTASITQNGFIYRPRLLNLFCPDAYLALNGVRSVWSVSGVTDTFRTISLEAGKANINVRDVKVTSAVPTTLLFVNPVDGLDSTHSVILADSDWTQASGAVAGYTNTDQRRYVRHTNIRLATSPGVTSLTVGASPFTYTNFNGYQQQVFVSAGTVSLIELDGGTGTFVTTGVISGGFMLASGQSLRITHSVTPTARISNLET